MPGCCNDGQTNPFNDDESSCTVKVRTHFCSGKDSDETSRVKSSSYGRILLSLGLDADRSSFVLFLLDMVCEGLIKILRRL